MIKKRYWIFKQKLKYYRQFKLELNQLRYFKMVREVNFQRQNIGLQDFSMRSFDKLKPDKKLIIHSGCSENNAIKFMYLSLIELLKLSKLSKKMLISDNMMKVFYEVNHKEYNKSEITISLINKIYNKEVKKERKVLY